MTAEKIQAAIEYAKAHQDEYIEGFKELLRIPSISTDPSYEDEVARAAEWVKAEMERIGLTGCRVIPTDGHPVVYGEWLQAGDDKPTVLLYAHYDVQPVDPLELWDNPPFDPIIEEGDLIARGTSDNKCGIWGNLKTIESILQANGTLPINIKVLFEGEEESGSPNMEPFVRDNTELLKADVLLNTDGGFDPDQPEIGYAGRGIVAAEVRLKGPGSDLHSGLYGGFVHNPLHMAGTIIGSFHDADGRVQLPGYYDSVNAITDDERQLIAAMWEKIGKNIEDDADVEAFWGNTAPLPERATVLPTLEVNGMWGGYQGPGTKTIIPAEAGFKVTMRLVPDQNPKEMAQKLVDYVMGFQTDTVKIEVKILTTGYPFALEFDGPRVEAVQKALEATTGKRALMVRTGGSIPILGMFNQFTDMAITDHGYGAGGGVHSPNEYVNVEKFFQAVHTAIHIFYNFSEM